MGFTVACSACGSAVTLPDGPPGKRYRCPACKQSLPVGAGSTRPVPSRAVARAAAVVAAKGRPAFELDLRGLRIGITLIVLGFMGLLLPLSGYQLKILYWLPLSMQFAVAFLLAATGTFFVLSALHTAGGVFTRWFVLVPVYLFLSVLNLMALGWTVVIILALNQPGVADDTPDHAVAGVALNPFQEAAAQRRRESEAALAARQQEVADRLDQMRRDRDAAHDRFARNVSGNPSSPSPSPQPDPQPAPTPTPPPSGPLTVAPPAGMSDDPTLVTLHIHGATPADFSRVMAAIRPISKGRLKVRGPGVDPDYVVQFVGDVATVRSQITFGTVESAEGRILSVKWTGTPAQ